MQWRDRSTDRPIDLSTCRPVDIWVLKNTRDKVTPSRSSSWSSQSSSQSQSRVAAVAMRRWRALALVAALSRVAIFIACARAPAALTAALARRVELTSAVDALRRTLEGAHARAVFGASAYDGNAFHGHPIVVFAVERIARWAGSGGTTSGVGVELATASAWLAADSVALALLCALATTVTTDMDGVFRVCALYALNPINAMALMARSNAAVGRACVFAARSRRVEGTSSPRASRAPWRCRCNRM